MSKRAYKLASILMVLIFIMPLICAAINIDTREAAEESITLIAPTPVIVYAAKTLAAPTATPEKVVETKVEVHKKSQDKDVIKSMSVDQDNEEQDESTTEINMGEYTITAYCGCKICCGRWAENRKDGKVYGAYGYELKEGVSVASPLPKGTRIKIAGLDNVYTVQDTTADWVADKYNDRIVDIYFSNHAAAEAFNKKKVDIYIVKED